MPSSKLLLEHGGDRAQGQLQQNTADLRFAKSGQEAVVKLHFLSMALDLESEDYHGRTPLAWAARNGQEVIVKLLLGNGAKVDSRNESRRHGARMFAAWKRSSEVDR